MLLLPVFTPFTVGPKQMGKGLSAQKIVVQSRPVISMQMTTMNVKLTFTCYIIALIIECIMADNYLNALSGSFFGIHPFLMSWLLTRRFIYNKQYVWQNPSLTNHGGT